MDEAICAVVMMRGPIVSEENLMGAFWLAVRRSLCHHREGRHQLRVGSQTRAELETLDTFATLDDGPGQHVEMFERMAQAADLMARLDDFERRVVVAMAVRGAGLRRTAGLLGVPLAKVKAAVRSAEEKLQQSAAIAAAGRMCEYRTSAITAHAEGLASEEQLRAARAHLAACTSCRNSYVSLVRQMRSQGFQRRAAAAFLPVPLVAAAHHVGVLLRRALDRLGLPEGFRDRAAEALGGAGIAKAAAAGGAVVAATATIAVSLHHATEHPKAHSRHPPPTARAWSASRRASAPVAASPIWHVQRSTAATQRPRPPRKRPLPAADREFSFEGARASQTVTRSSPAPQQVTPPKSGPAAHEFGFESPEAG